MSYQEEFEMQGSYMVLCGEKVKTDIDEYLIKRYTNIKNKAELELETCEMYGDINLATKAAKNDALSKIALVNHLLQIKEKQL